MFILQDFVKRTDHIDSSVLYNLHSSHFFKMPKTGMDFLISFLGSAECGKEMLGALSEEDYKRFMSLLGYLKQNGYLHESNKANNPTPPKARAAAQKDLIEQFLKIKRSAYYEVCNECNLSCRFCYTNPRKTMTKIGGNLSFSKKIIDKAKRLSIDTLVISGGEPLLRKDIIQVIEYAKKRMNSVYLVTNGTLIDPKTAQALKGSGIDLVSISIESPERVIHDDLRGQGSYEKALAGLQHLKDAGFDKNNLNIVATINRLNFHVLHTFSEFAEKLNVKMNFSLFKKVGRGFSQDDLELTDEQYCQFILMLNEKKADVVLNGDQADGLSECESCSKMVPTIKTSCGIVKETLGIKCTGELVPCHLFFSADDPKMIIGNITERAIGQKLWAFFQENIPSVDEKGECRDCNVKYFCGGSCYAPGYFDGGSLSSATPSCSKYKIYFSSLIKALGNQDEFGAFRKILRSRFENGHPEEDYCLTVPPVGIPRNNTQQKQQ